MIRNKLLKVFCCLLLMLQAVVASATEELNPVADSAAVVISGKVRFTVLTSRMIRIEYSPSGVFEDRATFAIVNRRLPVPNFTTRTEGVYLYITTDDCELRYKVGSTPRTSDANGNNLQITFSMNGTSCVWYPGKDDNMNLLGTNRTLDTAWGDNARNKLEKGLLSRAGWAIIDESPATTRGDGSTTFAFENLSDGRTWWALPMDAKSTDWYFLGYGHDYKQCLMDFIKVGGRVPLPPKYIFGYWYSRYWAYSQSDFMTIISDVEKNDIPMDVLIMDMDWHRSGWTGWSWNTSKIPTPTTLISNMHSHGLRTALNLHPSDGVKSSEDKYRTLANHLGYASTSTDAIPWTIQDSTFAKYFFKDILRPLETQGVDFWWIDWQQEKTVGAHATAKGYTCPEGGENLGETFWCNHTFFQDMQLKRPTKRTVIYHRWGGLGSHRYPICFSGDTNAAWSTLGYEIFFTSNASNVCYDYWGHDLGGHQGGNNDPELLLRWLQFGAYTPIFRTHATNDSKLERRIWKYSNFTQLREAVRERYRMFPYLYTAARETYDTGIGMNRPLYYDYPEEENAYTFEDEYMFGNDMLVAPIYTASVNGKSTRSLWLPEGKWWDVTRGLLLNGSRVMAGTFTLDQFPVYYKAGSVIPFYPVQRSTVTNPQKIILKVVPGASGRGSFYEDNGANNKYLDGECATTTFTQQRNGEDVTLTIGGRVGTYSGIPSTRTWELQFLGVDEMPDTPITVNDVAVDSTMISLDAEAKVLTVTVAVTNLSNELVVKAKIPEPQAYGTADDQEAKIYEPTSTYSGVHYYIKGSAVPGGMQELTRYPKSGASGYTYKFHGTLLPGKLYIANGKLTSSRLLKPKQVGSNIVCDDIAFTISSPSDSLNSAWTVSSRSDFYRFTVTPSSTSSTATGTVTGEIFNRWYEAWIVGGCVADDQTPGEGNWQLSAGKAMTQDWWNPEIFTWTGELKNYTTNDEPKRLKIDGQYGWSPKVLHPFVQDESLLTTSQACYNGSNDYKWSIGADGYYTIEVNVFLETIQATYHGTDAPDGLVCPPALEAGVRINGNTIKVESQYVVNATLYTIDGKIAGTSQGSSFSMTAPSAGTYILYLSNGTEFKTCKIKF